MRISFITLRRRSPQLLKEIVLLPRSAWRTLELDVPARKYRTPRVYEQKVRLAGRSFRQVYILDLGHELPTILLTNEARTPIKQLITRYAHRMLIGAVLPHGCALVGRRPQGGFRSNIIGDRQRPLPPPRPPDARLT